MPEIEQQKEQNRVPEKREPNRVLLVYPPWAKLIVAVASAVCLAAAVAFTFSVQTFVSMVRQANDPVLIAQNLKKIAAIDKLPPGFDCQLAVSSLGYGALTLVYKPDETNLMLFTLPADKRLGDARELADRMTERGIPTISDDFRVSHKDATDFSRHKLEYNLGNATNMQGITGGGLIGCAELSDKRVLLVYGWTPAGREAKPASAAANPPTSQEPTSKGAQVTAPASFDLDALKKLLMSMNGL